jgi:hypothetical protein
MTKIYDKIEKLPNRREVYKEGFNRGFGRCLKFTVAFLRQQNFSEKTQSEVITFVLNRKLRKKGEGR